MAAAASAVEGAVGCERCSRAVDQARGSPEVAPHAIISDRVTARGSRWGEW
jgi:hypothetical protein